VYKNFYIIYKGSKLSEWVRKLFNLTTKKESEWGGTMFRIALILSTLFAMLAAQEQTSAPVAAVSMVMISKWSGLYMISAASKMYPSSDVAKIEEGRVVSP
jgi:hypothetical protein